MEHNYQDVKAKCLFCGATVEDNQRSMVGRWDGPYDLEGKWIEEKPMPKWLCNGTGNMESGVWQVFYLCPEHNNPRYYDIARSWASEQLQKGEIVDFSDTDAITLSPSEIKRLEERPPFSDRVPTLEEVCEEDKLPNAWQAEDPRLEGSMEVAWALDDVEKWSKSWDALELAKLDEYPKPLELAKALKKVARNIELLTRSEEPSAKQKAN